MNVPYFTFNSFIKNMHQVMLEYSYCFPLPQCVRLEEVEYGVDGLWPGRHQHQLQGVRARGEVHALEVVELDAQVAHLYGMGRGQTGDGCRKPAPYLLKHWLFSYTISNDTISHCTCDPQIC